MMPTIKKITIYLLFGCISTAYNLDGCLTTFINDKNEKIMIYNESDQTIIPIDRHAKRRFGNQREHAHFSICTKVANQPLFSKSYTCRQLGCGKDGNVQLKLSDIENETSVTRLFSIVRHEPHSSMVDQVTIAH
jgi:hypothetical protein